MTNVHDMLATTIRNRAMMANALCSVAEQEIHAGRVIEAKETVRSIRALLGDIGILLSGDTSYLPYGTLRNVSDLVAGLDGRIGTLEQALGPSTVQ
jgi:hypothetical protein